MQTKPMTEALFVKLTYVSGQNHTSTGQVNPYSLKTQTFQYTYKRASNGDNKILNDKYYTYKVHQQRKRQHQLFKGQIELRVSNTYMKLAPLTEASLKKLT